MKSKTTLVSLSFCVLALLLAVSLQAGLAQGPVDREEPAASLSIEASVSSKFSYQGMLREDGAPVNGTRDLLFHIYQDAACTTLVSGDIALPDTPITDGLFSVELPVSSSYLNGQALWLGVQVSGTDVGCFELMAVPYALSLRPGARIIGEQVNWDAIHAENTATAGLSYGVYASSASTSGRGVVGFARDTTGVNYGLYGRTDSASGAGVYARGLNAGVDVLLAGNADTTAGDDGVLSSDPNYPSSDLIFLTNDGIRIELDDNGDGEDSDIEVRNMAGSLIFNIDESGAVTMGGAGLAAFPRPAYDSGWLSLTLGESRTITHNLGGNTDNYVVDLTCRRTVGGAGVNNWGIGGDANGSEYYGAWWSNLSTTSVILHRWSDDSDCPNLRARIWMYP